RGTGVASDGRGASLFNPEPAGQARAVRRAWASAGLDPTAPGALGLLEAHGTGTPAGDTAELVTVADVFGPPGTGPRAVIGSVKSMIGHAMPAAGVAGLVKAALAVHRGVLPPTLHCDDPRPELDRTRFAPTATARPWERGHAPRRAGVNAFGFGGINAHVVLEEPPDTDKDTTVAVPVRPPSTAAAEPERAHPPSTVTEPERGRPPSIVAGPERVRPPAAVAEPERALRMVAPDHAALAALLDADDATVRALWSGVPEPGAEGCRMGIVDPTAKRLGLARRIAALGPAWRGRSDIWFSPAPRLRSGRTAVVFPGL